MLLSLVNDQLSPSKQTPPETVHQIALDETFSRLCELPKWHQGQDSSGDLVWRFATSAAYGPHLRIKFMDKV